MTAVYGALGIRHCTEALCMELPQESSQELSKVELRSSGTQPLKL